MYSFWFLDLGKIVRVTYGECLGPLEQEVSTMDLLKRIELRMEVLTQNLERLPLEKVKIAQRVSDNAFPYYEIIIQLHNLSVSRRPYSSIIQKS